MSCPSGFLGSKLTLKIHGSKTWSFNCKSLKCASSMINVVLTSENESAFKYFQLWMFVSKVLSHTNVPSVITVSCFRKYFLLKCE